MPIIIYDSYSFKAPELVSEPDYLSFSASDKQQQKTLNNNLRKIRSLEYREKLKPDKTLLIKVLIGLGFVVLLAPLLDLFKMRGTVWGVIENTYLGIFVIALSAVVVLGYQMWLTRNTIQQSIDDEIEWREQVFQIAKLSSDYRDFKLRHTKLVASKKARGA